METASAATTPWIDTFEHYVVIWICTGTFQRRGKKGSGTSLQMSVSPAQRSTSNFSGIPSTFCNKLSKSGFSKRVFYNSKTLKEEMHCINGLF